MSPLALSLSFIICFIKKYKGKKPHLQTKVFNIVINLKVHCVIYQDLDKSNE